jgi:hypothetical protein
MREKDKMLKKGFLSEMVVELVPGAREGFDKFGESYAYHWATYFYDQTLALLRHEISGADDIAKAAKSAESLALDSRRAQLAVRANLEAAGLPERLINEDQTAAANTLVEKATHRQ